MIQYKDLVQFKIFVNIADLSCMILCAQNVVIPVTHYSYLLHDKDNKVCLRFNNM